MKKKLQILLFILIAIFINLNLPGQNWHPRFHENSNALTEKGGALPMGFNDLFAGSGECMMCHNAQVNLQGESISILSDWRSAMMANTARDPLWQAKVSHEGLVNPQHKEVLEDVCTRCHAPAGNHNAHHNGQALYSADEMRADPLAMDGVQCTVCHQIKESSLGSFSGQVEIGTEKKIWGPYVNPFTNPMINNIGYTPEYSNHINDAKLCGACHTLITNTVDLNGVLTGGQFVEQAIFQEWENSVHPSAGTTCQLCHVPRIDDPVKISSMPPWLDPRSPFGMHQFAGANVFMSRLLKDFGGQIGVTASPTQFDSTIARSTRMLQNQTLDLLLSEEMRTADTLFVSLLLQNKAGHKFPAGYPSRRAFVELIATNEAGDTIFHSGKTDENFNLIAEDVDFESHFTVINSEEQVQIYEMVMGDVNGDVTTVLERAADHLKDNRIPPVGFSTGHFSYDTTQIVGAAFYDPDFNYESGNEGSGSDNLKFHIPLDGFGGMIQVVAKVYYQTVNDKWLEHMFGYSSTEIDAFKSYYDNADKTPVLVGSENISSAALSMDDNLVDDISVFPNPARDVLNINFGSKKVESISLFDLRGVLKSEHFVDENSNGLKIDLSGYSGIHFIKLNFTDGKSMVQKVLVN